MGVASMVIGILGTICGWIPFFGWIWFIPSLVALVMGIVDTVRKSRQHLSSGPAIAGIVLNSVALGFVILMTVALLWYEYLPCCQVAE